MSIYIDLDNIRVPEGRKGLLAVDIHEMMDSLGKYGLQVPIKVKRVPLGYKEHYEVISDHLLLAAAKALGWKNVECEVVEDVVPRYINVDDIWIEGHLRGPHDEDEPEFVRLKQSIATLGMSLPIAVRPRVAGGWALLDGLARLQVAKLLGWKQIPAKVESEVKVVTADRQDPLMRALDIHDHCSRHGEHATRVKFKLHGTGQLEHYLEIAKTHLVELKIAEEHGKVIARQEVIVEHNEAKVLENLARKSLDMLGVPVDTKTPKERGKKLCLEPGCRTWITGRMGTFAWVNFCKKHTKCTFEAFPLRDRDGDPIWVGRGYQVTKMHLMEDSHVLNSIGTCEGMAARREELTRKPKADTLRENLRYQLLVAELKQRDACKSCKGGLILACAPDSIDPVEDVRVDYCTCPLGLEKRACAQIAEQAKRDRATPIIALAFAIVTALLVGSGTEVAFHFIEAVHARLKAMGLL